MASGLLIFYSKDAHFKMNCWIKDLCLPESTIIDKTCVEKMPFPLKKSRIQRFSKYRACIVVISKGFLQFLESRSEDVFTVGRLLRPSSTMGVLYGVAEDDVLCFHKAAFFSYDAWPKFEVHEWSFRLPQSIIKTTKDLMVGQEDASFRGNSPISSALNGDVLMVPKRVNRENQRVYLILSGLLSDIEKINILLECTIVKEVTVEKVNPYVASFDIPDDFFESCEILNVHIRHGKSLLAIKQLEWESDPNPSEHPEPSTQTTQSSSSSSTNSLTDYKTPYDTAMFPNAAPRTAPEIQLPTGQTLLQDETEDLKQDDIGTEFDEIPSLLELWAKYGMDDLTLDHFIDRAVQKCRALELEETAGNKTPSVILSSHKGQETLREESKEDIEVPLRNSSSAKEIRDELNRRSFYTSQSSPPIKIPEMRRSASLPWLLSVDDSTGLEENKDIGTDSMYISMTGSRNKGPMPHEMLLKETPKGQRMARTYNSFNSRDHIYASLKLPEESTNEIKRRLSRSQQELLNLLEAFKGGLKTLSEVEELFQSWHERHECSIDDTVTLRHGGGKKQSKPRKRQSFGLPDLIRMLAGRTKKKRNKPKVEDRDKPIPFIKEVGISAADRYMKSLSKLSCSSTSSTGSVCSEETPGTGSKLVDRKRDSGNHSDINEELRKKAQQEDPSTKWFCSLSPKSRMAYCPIEYPGDSHLDEPSREQEGNSSALLLNIPAKKSKPLTKSTKKPRDPSPDYITPIRHQAPAIKTKDTGFLLKKPTLPPLPKGPRPLNISSAKANQDKKDLRKISTPGIGYFRNISPKSSQMQPKQIGFGGLTSAFVESMNSRSSSCPMLVDTGTDSSGEASYITLLPPEGHIQHLKEHFMDEEKRDSIPNEPPPPLPPPRR